jgi:hypothetical protein
MPVKHVFAGCLAATALLIVGCGGPGTEKAELASAPPIDPAKLGNISGSVRFQGDKPVPKTLSMDATPACARMHSGPIYSEEVVVNSNGTLKNVLVWIKAGLPERRWPVPSTSVKLDQMGCIYRPHVLGVMVNQPLEISNSDSTNHNVHPLPKINREWNESQPPKGEVKVKTFARAEMPPILFKCNVHPWMRAWVGVVSHPFFAVTGDDGSFILKDVPAGEYALEAWHEKFGTMEMKITVEPRQTAPAEFSFKG